MDFLNPRLVHFTLVEVHFPIIIQSLGYLNLEFWKLFFIFLNFVLGI